MCRIRPGEQGREGLPLPLPCCRQDEERRRTLLGASTFLGSIPHLTPNRCGRGPPRNLLLTHSAGPSGESLPLLQQYLPGVLVAVDHHHVVGAHPEGIEAAIAALQAPEPQVQLGVPGQLQQAPHQRQGWQASRSPQTCPRPQGGSPACQPPGAEQGQDQEQDAQQRHGGASCGAAAAQGAFIPAAELSP